MSAVGTSATTKKGFGCIITVQSGGHPHHVTARAVLISGDGVLHTVPICRHDSRVALVGRDQIVKCGFNNKSEWL